MSNPEHVHRALAELAPGDWPFYDDEAPTKAVAPWLVGSLLAPESILGESAVHGGIARWRVTVCARTAAQARVMAQACHDAWSLARLDVDGYLIGAVVPKAATGPYAAGLTALDTDLGFQVVTLAFDLTLGRAAAAV